MSRLHQIIAGSHVAPSGSIVSGGDSYVPGNGYEYRIFLTPGNLVVTGSPLTVEVLIVAGGGAGGGAEPYGGGGGAGGVQLFSSIFLDPGTYPITVGTGGGATAGQGGNGADSSAFGYSSTGGGGGAVSPSLTFAPGGSGGGGVNSPPTGTTPIPSPLRRGSGIPGQGYPGGIGYPPSLSGSGGGGGGAGGSGSGFGLRNPGGPGAPYPEYAGPLFPGMPGAWISAVGSSGYYGGGGGGGRAGPAYLSAATGGAGGGGSGAYRNGPPPIYYPATSGVDYTGGGGGGARPNVPVSGNGGDGIVIVKYSA